MGEGKQSGTYYGRTARVRPRVEGIKIASASLGLGDDIICDDSPRKGQNECQTRFRANSPLSLLHPPPPTPPAVWVGT